MPRPLPAVADEEVAAVVVLQVERALLRDLPLALIRMPFLLSRAPQQEPRRRLLLVRVEAVVVVAVVQAEVVVVAAAVAPRSQRLAPKDEEAFSSPGTLSLRKKHGVDRPVQARASMPVALSRLPVIWCSQMSRITCLHSKQIPASRFSIWLPVSRTPDHR